MIERNLKLLIGLSIYILLTFIVPIPFVIIFERPDILGITCIISCLLLLLFINFRSSKKLKTNFKKKYYKDKKPDNDNYKESQRILWVVFLILAIITVIVCLTV